MKALKLVSMSIVKLLILCLSLNQSYSLKLYSEALSELLNSPIYSNLYLPSCRHGEEGDKCGLRPVYLSDAQNQVDVIQRLTAYCAEEVANSSPHNPYFSGYRSVIECVRTASIPIVKRALHNHFGEHVSAVHMLHPLVDLSPSEGCGVNWMWDLDVFERGKYSQVPTISCICLVFSCAVV
jgi:hypothetical protein